MFKAAKLFAAAAEWLFCGLLLAGAANAGAPFRTDDPGVPGYSHWEFFTFSTGTHVKEDTSAALPAWEFNYGVFPNAMIHVVAPVAFDSPAGRPTVFGSGDTELGFKYRFIEQEKSGTGLSIGAFPLIQLPSGDQDKGLGAGHVRAFLPIWIQKDFGDWTTYGGGGYWINKNNLYGDKDYWFAGWLLQRKISDKLAIGSEIFYQTANTVNGVDSAGVNVGGQYDFDEHHHLLFSVGRGFLHARETNMYSWYLGWQITY